MIATFRNFDRAPIGLTPEHVVSVVEGRGGRAIVRTVDGKVHELQESAEDVIRKLNVAHVTGVP